MLQRRINVHSFDAAGATACNMRILAAFEWVSNQNLQPNEPPPEPGAQGRIDMRQNQQIYIL